MSARFFNVLVSTVFTISSVAQAQSKGAPTTDLETRLYQEIAAEEGYVETATARGFFEEVSDGLSSQEVIPKCDPRRLEDNVIGKNLSNAQYFKVLKAYFSSCSSELTKGSTTGLLSLLKFSKYVYPFLSHPQVKEFHVKLADGTRVPGIIALKQDPTPRPLVIVKCGVFCSAAQTPSMKAYLMHLFDQSPFNVLLLANQTGMDYIYYNQRVTLGGHSEGLEAIEVGRYMLEKWEHRDRISSLHLMGISLGGNAAVMGAAYNDQYPRANGQKVFNSVAAICPVISLRPTLDHLYGSQVIGRVFSKMTREHFSEARNYVTDVPDMITDDKIPDTRLGMADYIGNLASTSLQRRGIASTMPTFFKNNNFWNLKSTVRTPLLVWASKDDSVVNNRINAEVMEHDDLYENLSNVGVLNLKYGNHCAFQSSYGAQASAAVLRTFVLNNSPEFVNEYAKKARMPWTLGFKKLASRYEHIGQNWNFYSQNDQVKVTFKVFDWNGGSRCAEQGPWSGSSVCVSKKEYWIPISSLSSMGARIPRNTVEAQTLTREFNTKIEFRIEGHPLNGTNASDFFMVWRGHYQ